MGNEFVQKKTKIVNPAEIETMDPTVNVHICSYQLCTVKNNQI
jgi:hypothetical protein